MAPSPRSPGPPDENSFKCAVRIRPVLSREVDMPVVVKVVKDEDDAAAVPATVPASVDVKVEDPVTGEGREFFGLPLVVGPEASQGDAFELLGVR